MADCGHHTELQFWGYFDPDLLYLVCPDSLAIIGTHFYNTNVDLLMKRCVFVFTCL